MNDELLSSKTNGWETPQAFFDALDAEFHFTLDPCCTHKNAKCAKHYTAEEDGLSQDWTGETVFCNPPYGRELPKWIEKCATARNASTTVVMLIPARTDTRAYHNYILGVAEIRFIKGRLKFVGATKTPLPLYGGYKLDKNGAMITHRDDICQPIALGFRNSFYTLWKGGCSNARRYRTQISHIGHQYNKNDGACAQERHT